MEAVNISEFRRICLRVLDRLPSTGLVITRNGRPVAKVTPLPADPRSLIGSVPQLRVRADDDLLSTHLHWDAES
jgi:antitoxin (DNA-binding transcriptional repressor) of toxin-antitoxin stability system